MKILIQTTTSRFDGDWHAATFSTLAKVLQNDGHTVVSRDREPGEDGSDPVLSSLAESDFGQLWLMAADRGNALSPKDVRAILRFRERGGGVLTAREHENYGTSILNLGTLGAVNHFKNFNPERGVRGRRRSRPQRDYRRIVALEPVHEVLRSANSPTGLVEFFPDHPNEGALSVPGHVPYARAIAASQGGPDGRTVNLAIAIENEPAAGGRPCGRAIAISSIHQFTDPVWALIEESGHLEAYKDYARNIARWLQS
ncbi:MAG TPA: hypothetical protein VGZ02_04050 [Candidatus Baltobacteraceae bacterium]|jgi:hypothetical protein|nr:hypothetical protein [Candidatus Baltobacteraceae bacterium]